MVKVICQHSGIEFEADSKRSKNHPMVSDLKNRANKDGNYREVNNAMDAVKKAGGYATIEEYMKMVHDHINGKKQAIKDREAKFAERERANAEREQRFEAWLPEKGYVSRTETYQEWRDNPNPIDAMDEGEYVTRTRIIWAAPDGQTIEKYIASQIFDGKYTLAEYRAQEQAKADAKAQKEAEEIEREKAHDESLIAFDAKAQEIKAQCVQVERFDDRGGESVITTKRGNSYYRFHDTIERVEVNNATCYVITTGTGYDDDGYPTYWTTFPAPEAIGFTRYEEPESDGIDYSRFDWF